MKLRRLLAVIALAVAVIFAGTPAFVGIGAGEVYAQSAGASAKSDSQSEKKDSKEAESKPEGKGYTNVDGKHVKSPTKAATPPKGATAQCRDGSYSFSAHRSGARALITAACRPG